MTKKILITGGCGFIGTNAARFYLQKGYTVISVDNLKRNGSKKNLGWLKTLKGNFTFEKADIVDFKKLSKIFNEYKPDLILHLAAQTTVVDSVSDPRNDFYVNALGTFNVLEAVRKEVPLASLIYSSTNKVFGDLKQIPIAKKGERYFFKYIKGISEKYPLNFQSPYGCSKGCGDQYVLDYAKLFKLKTVVFRQSCIYGPNQFGKEEQGWLTWFVVSSILGNKVTVYGDGKQVRDVLYIDDLINAYDLAFTNISKTRGKVYNIGGSIKFILSVLESFKIIEKLANKKINFKFGPWRPSDQKVYISDISSAKKDFGWSPEISPKIGIARLYKWVAENKHFFKSANILKK